MVSYLAFKPTRATLPLTFPETFGKLAVDTTGNPCVWENAYICRGCDEVWTDTWSWQCDDECPECGTSVSPETSDWIGPTDAASLTAWEEMADK